MRRIAYNLFTQKPKQEKADFARWIKMTGPGKGDDYRVSCTRTSRAIVTHEPRRQIIDP